MGKSKKKKNKNADFQKVKLKVGKTKPVGTNVTNTAFQSSTIQIGAQFESGNEPVNRKKLSLKDLLHQLNHYNVNVRNDALGGLRDLFQTHPSVMHDQLSIWISKVFGRITDTDATVRHSLNLCLNHVFGELLELEVSPFFKIIITHICCGLTHINEGVQLDSLDILGIIIERYPSSFIPYHDKILEHVIDLISKQDMKETSSMKGGKIGKGISSLVSRQLLSNADGRLGNFKTRTRILEQLYVILKVFRQPKEESKEGLHNDDENVISVTNDKPVYMKLFKYGLNPISPEHIPIETWLEMNQQNKVMNTTGYTERLISKIFPLILNIWVEFEPSKLSSNLNDLQCSRSLLSGIKVIVDILDTLLDPNQSCDKTFHENVAYLFKSFGKELSLHFFSAFILPIQSKSMYNKSIKSSNPDILQKCSIDFNFLMGKLICSLLKPLLCGSCLIIESKLRVGYLKDLNTFINQIVELNNLVVDSGKIAQLLTIIDELLKIKKKCEKKEGELIDSATIFGNILKVYKMASLSSPWKLPLFTFFSKYVMQEQYKLLLEENVRLKCLKDFTESVVDNIWTLPSSSEVLITESFRFLNLILVRNLMDEKVLPNLSKSLVEITNPSGLFKNLKDDLQRCVIEIIFHLDIPNDLMKNLCVLCHMDTISESVKKYIISIVGYCTYQKEKCLELERYIGFILTVIVGFSMDDLLKFNVERPNSVSWSILNIFPSKTKDIPVDFAITQLEHLNGLNHAFSILIPVIGRFLIQLRKLPVTVVVGLVKILDYFSTRRVLQDHSNDSLNTIGSEINQIADLISATLLYSISSTYKSFSKADSDFLNDGNHLIIEDNLVSSCINILFNNHILLRLLIKKWINVLGEYKMNALCVNSIVEVLIQLLKDPKLLTVLSEFKNNFQSIVNAFYPVCPPQVHRYLIEQLKMQVLLL